MTEQPSKESTIQKIGSFDKVEILLNEKQEMLFEGIIDPPYIYLHFERIVKVSRDFDNVKLVGYDGSRRKEMIAEVFVSR